MINSKARLISAVDIFCGIGGLSYGLKQAGINVKGGIDFDKTCQYAYENNVKAKMTVADISTISGEYLIKNFWQEDNSVKLLVGCAPCQTFSTLSGKIKNKEGTEKWNLLLQFQRLVEETSPQLVSMENVPNLANQKIFKDFVTFLKSKGYYVNYANLFCPDYGIPQNRRRLVLLASKFGEISLPKKTHHAQNYKTTLDAISYLPPVDAGARNSIDKLHVTQHLSHLNKKRIQQSKPNGTWMDWDENLRLKCHQKDTVKGFRDVYGRISWDKPSPTITTKFCAYSTGRFGHPEQNRALTIREGALLQTFPKNYKFTSPHTKEIPVTVLSRHIGNAVPVDLGKAIGKAVNSHIRTIFL